MTVCAAAPALTVKLDGLTVNCGASVPDTAMDETASVAVPVLETVNVNDLFFPVCTSPKVSAVPDRPITDRRVSVAWFDSPLLLPAVSTALTLK